MKTKKRYYRRSRIAELIFRRLIKAFAMDLTATDTVELTGLSVRSVNMIYRKIRQRVADRCEAPNPFRGKWKSTNPTSAQSVYAVNGDAAREVS